MPVVTAPKSKADTLVEPAVCSPVPKSRSTWLLTLVGMVSSPVATPDVVGLKDTVYVQFAPGAKVAPQLVLTKVN